MSRYYEMTAEIEDFDTNRTEQIVSACNKEWNFKDCFTDTLPAHCLTLVGKGDICGGESEEEFVDRLAAAIWQANEGFCGINVQAIYLEIQPCERHTRQIDDYRDWRAEGNP